MTNTTASAQEPTKTKLPTTITTNQSAESIVNFFGPTTYTVSGGELNSIPNTNGHNTNRNQDSGDEVNENKKSRIRLDEDEENRSGKSMVSY